MAKNRFTSSILPAKKAGKKVLQIAEENVAKTTAEIKNKIAAKQQSTKRTTVKKKPSVKKVAAKKQSSGRNTVSSNPLKLLITIVNRNKAEFYLDLIQSYDVNIQCVVLGEGTADKSMLGLLGLSDNDKAVILSVIQQQKLPDALAGLEHKFNSIKGGKGVAWTVSLTSVIGVLIYGFLSNNRETVKEDNNGRN